MTLDTPQEVTKLSKKIPVENFSRVCGYYRPKSQANPGKIAEIEDRLLFDVNNKEKTYPQWNTKKTVKI